MWRCSVSRSACVLTAPLFVSSPSGSPASGPSALRRGNLPAPSKSLFGPRAEPDHYQSILWPTPVAPNGSPEPPPCSSPLRADRPRARRPGAGRAVYDDGGGGERARPGDATPRIRLLDRGDANGEPQANERGEKQCAQGSARSSFQEDDRQ